MSKGLTIVANTQRIVIKEAFSLGERLEQSLLPVLQPPLAVLHHQSGNTHSDRGQGFKEIGWEHQSQGEDSSAREKSGLLLEGAVEVTAPDSGQKQTYSKGHASLSVLPAGLARTRTGLRWEGKTPAFPEE